MIDLVKCGAAALMQTLPHPERHSQLERLLTRCAHSPLELASNRGRLSSLARKRLQHADIFFRPLAALCLLPGCHSVSPNEYRNKNTAMRCDIFATNRTTNQVSFFVPLGRFLPRLAPRMISGALFCAWSYRRTARRAKPA